MKHFRRWRLVTSTRTCAAAASWHLQTLAQPHRAVLLDSLLASHPACGPAWTLWLLGKRSSRALITNSPRSTGTLWTIAPARSVATGEQTFGLREIGGYKITNIS